jgi:hypothetical protein
MRPDVNNLQAEEKKPNCQHIIPSQGEKKVYNIGPDLYLAFQPHNIPQLGLLEKRHVQSPRRARRGPPVRPRNREQSLPRADVVEGSLGASCVLLVGVQVFLLHREAPDQLAALLACLGRDEFELVAPA